MMKARFSIVSLVAAVVCGGGCAPIAFANVTVKVREPAGSGLRQGADVFTNLFFALDDEKALSNSAADGADIVTHPIELGNEKHTLHLIVSVNAIALDQATALGRADDIELPAFSDPVVQQKGGGRLFEAEEQALIAVPNTPSPVKTDVPGERAGGAACDEKSGRGWFVGGNDNGVEDVQSYRFDELDLTATDAFNPGLTGAVACDGDEHGHVFIYEPAAETLHVDARGENRLVHGVNLGSAQAPYVGVRGEHVWVGAGAGVALFTASGNPLANLTLSLDDTAHFLALSETALVRFNNDGNANVVTLNADGNLVAPEQPGANVIAVDNDASLVLTRGGQLVRPRVDDAGTLTFDTLRTINFVGILPTELIVLPHLDVAVLLDGVNDLLLVEGQSTVVSAPREHMLRTKGDAVILFGKGTGHDVVVAPALASEVERTTPDPK